MAISILLTLTAVPATAQSNDQRIEFRPEGDAGAGPPIVLSFKGEL